MIQVKKEPTNEEAMQQIQLLAPVHSDILTAKDFYRNRQYDAAIEILSRIIDVCIEWMDLSKLICILRIFCEILIV